MSHFSIENNYQSSELNFHIEQWPSNGWVDVSHEVNLVDSADFIVFDGMNLGFEPLEIGAWGQSSIDIIEGAGTYEDSVFTNAMGLDKEMNGLMDGRVYTGELLIQLICPLYG